MTGQLSEAGSSAADSSVGERQGRQPASLRETHPARVLRDAATEALREAGESLRRSGWDAKLTLTVAEPHEDHFTEVSLSIRIGHFLPIPDAARASATGDRAPAVTPETEPS